MHDCQFPEFITIEETFETAASQREKMFFSKGLSLTKRVRLYNSGLYLEKEFMEDRILRISQINFLSYISIIAISIFLSACGEQSTGASNTGASNNASANTTIESNNIVSSNSRNNNAASALEPSKGQANSQPAISTTTDSASGGITLSLSWLPNPEPVDGYVIYNGPTPEEAINKLSVTPQTTVQYDSITDLGLRSGDRTCFRLRAYIANDMSDFSQTVCVNIT